jgi:hypothetical protein
MSPVVDPKSVTLGFGQIMLVKRRDGDTLGIGFERDGQEVFTIWLANEAGAEALHSVSGKALRAVNFEQDHGKPEMEWKVVERKDPTP